MDTAARTEPVFARPEPISSFPLIETSRPRHPFEWTPEQCRQHGEQLDALRWGRLRGLPTVFGDLA